MRGVACFFGGLLFAVAVSEGMLRGICLHLPALFRALLLYYHTVLRLPNGPHAARRSTVERGTVVGPVGFSPAAALVFLTLVPAIRRGRDYVRDNGSRRAGRGIRGPCSEYSLSPSLRGRRLLCWSMHHVPSAGGEPYIFGPYFLVPFGLAVAAILLEIGLVERQQGVAVSAC